MSVSASIASPARANDSQVNDLFSRVVADLNDGIWKRNLKTGETWVSPRLMQALGFGANEYLPEKDPLGDWVHPEDAEAMQTVLRQTAKVIGQATFEVRLRNKFGSYRWFRCRARAWPGSDGKAALVLGALFDSHEERLALQETQQHGQQIAESAREKSRELEATVRDTQQRLLALERLDMDRTRFLLKASHELRTSLTNMLGMTELAQRTNDASTRQRRLEVALHAGKALQGTLDDVFEYAQIDLREPKRIDEEIDLSELTVAVCRDQAAILSSAESRIDVDFIGQHQLARGDGRSLSMLLHRLLKYVRQICPRAVIRFTTRVIAAADEQLSVRFEMEAALSSSGKTVVDRSFGSTTALGSVQEGADAPNEGLHLTIAERMVASLGGGLETVRLPGKVHSVAVTLLLARSLHEEEGIPQLAAGRKPETLWIVGHADSGAHLLARRVHRLGFDPLVLQSANEVLSQEERTGAPRWALIVESTSGMPLSFSEIRRLLPHTRLVFSAQDADPRPEAEAVGATVQRAPLSLGDLASCLVLRNTRRAAPVSVKGTKMPKIRRVLLVEDNAVSQLIMSELLGQLGLQVIVASTGEDGVDRFREHAPDAVLMDIGLPGIDGLEAAKRIRAIQLKGLVKRCPIIALTANALDSSREAWAQSGLDGYLAKPVDAAAIGAELQRLAGRDRST